MTSTRTRRTAQGAAVRTALESMAGFISAQELHRRLSDDGSKIGIATVYRQLNALVENQEADAISTPEGQLYRACEDPQTHHHHMVCTSCGTTIEIEPPDEAWFTSVARTHGFDVHSHTLEVFGICSACRSASSAR
ncbi:Fur family transcriptional regulator [Leucobacter chromiiresistens]|uniref:Peptide ABC transporter substrate-binding protein n=1 Tax=Leucobacter chromiiresistens TaxID=1079994 RepID=A0A147EC16_9MICO|nr:transcriptional repressor [Leucobacter chromiiresistens]KTR81905.1 peptide ABC transporter substrate-binding protein [Leucobacter chromiiresistens]